MLPGSTDQKAKPRPTRGWPQVANRHRLAAMAEAKRIMELIDEDFIELLQEQIGEDIEEAIMAARRNPTLAIRHLQLARRSLNTVVRSAELARKRAEAILFVLESAPADGVEDEVA